MLYPITRVIATIGLRIFFRKIYLSHVEKIPRDKPVILAANHPTAFLEPCILACFLDRPLYFLVRGDLFVKKFYIFLLRSLHMLPIYRKEDRGYKFLTANYSTFEACFDALHENKTIMILSEGRTRLAKRLHPLMKGTARMAFGTLEKYPDLAEVYIVPVGVNFTYGDRFRSDVMIDFGDPLLTRNYWAGYQENANKAIGDLTDDLYPRMKEGIIHIDDQADDELAEYLLVLTRNEEKRSSLPGVEHRLDPLQWEKATADRINTLSDPSKENLLEKARLYFRALEKNNLSDASVRWGPRFSGVQGLLLLLGLPIFAIGYLLNILPAWLAKVITKSSVERIEFYAPVLWGAALGTYLGYYILLMIFLPLLLGSVGWGVVVGAVLLGVFALYYRDAYLLWREDQAWKQMPAGEQEGLRQQRRTLREAFFS